MSQEQVELQQINQKARMAARASIVFFCIPIVLLALWVFLFFVVADNGGDGGLPALCFFAIGIGIGIHLTTVTSIIGSILAVWAIRKSKWHKGKVGLALNLIQLLLCLVLLVDM